MGNCCSANTQCKFVNTSLELRERWCLGNPNFDLLAYKKKLSMRDHVSFQQILLSCWMDPDLSLPLILTQPAQVDRLFLKELTDARLKGIPNDLIRDVLLRLVPFDDDWAREDRTEEPWFGRRSLKNVFLTRVGVGTSKRVLYMLQRSGGSRVVSLALPRMVQLMLWHLREHEVYALMLALLKDKRLPTSLGEHVSLVDAGLAMCGLVPSALTRHLFEDVVFNLCVRYLPVAFYPQMLITVVIEGMTGLLPYAVALFTQHSEFIAQLCAKATEPVRAIKELRRECQSHTIITSVLTSVYSMVRQLLPVSVASTELFSFLPVFNGHSNILWTDPMYTVFAESLPQTYMSIDLVPLSEDGESLMKELSKLTENVAVLIETRHYGMLAVVIEVNEYRLIHIIEHAEVFRGVGWTANSHNGLTLFRNNSSLDQEPNLRLNADCSEVTLHVPEVSETAGGLLEVQQVELLRLFK